MSNSRSRARANSTASTESTPRSSASWAVGVTASAGMPKRSVIMAMIRSATVLFSVIAAAPVAGGLLKVRFLEEDARVDTAEPKGVRHRDVGVRLTSVVRHIVEVALGVRSVVV